MTRLTPEAHQAWLQREPRMVLTTMDANCVPNTIWILCAQLLGDDKVVIANNAMQKTLDNVSRGCKGSLLYLAPEREAYQFKGKLSHHASGPVYADMKNGSHQTFRARAPY